MALLSQGSSVEESPEDKGASAPCVRGSAKISRGVTLALYTSPEIVCWRTVHHNAGKGFCGLCHGTHSQHADPWHLGTCKI